MKIDDKGRCPNCLRKPLPYRRERRFFCPPCCRSFDMDTGEQRPNWAWAINIDNGEFFSVYRNDDKHHYMNAKPTAVALKRSALTSR
jgi:hypothetical protein